MLEKLQKLLPWALALVVLILVLLNENRIEPQLGSSVSFNNFDNMSTSTNVAVSQGTLVLGTSTGRLYALFVNKGSTVIDLNLRNGNSVADNYTVRLTGQGSSYEILPENMYTGAVYASSTTSTTLSVTANQ